MNQIHFQTPVRLVFRHNLLFLPNLLLNFRDIFPPWSFILPLLFISIKVFIVAEWGDWTIRWVGAAFFTSTEMTFIYIDLHWIICNSNFFFIPSDNKMSQQSQGQFFDAVENWSREQCFRNVKSALPTALVSFDFRIC